MTRDTLRELVRIELAVNGKTPAALWPHVLRFSRTASGPALDGVTHEAWVSQLLGIDAVRQPHVRTTGQAVRTTPKAGVGTELHRLLAELGVTARSGCGCDDAAAEMDRRGIPWCEANVPAITAKLQANAAKVGWWDKLTAGVNAVLSGIAWRLDPTATLEGLVRMAIRRAKEKTQSHP